MLNSNKIFRLKSIPVIKHYFLNTIMLIENLIFHVYWVTLHTLLMSGMQSNLSRLIFYCLDKIFYTFGKAINTKCLSFSNTFNLGIDFLLDI